MSVTRRLTTVFYADVAGYSRLTGADEVGTHRRVMAMLDDVTARISQADGTVLRYAGDAVLATFPSVVLAVDTAAEIQNALADVNADIANDQRVQIRIGINLGDVIEDRGEVYGDGVNLSARLEAAAEPGGICLSAAAHDQVEGKVTASFIDGGEQNFKNIDKPVHIWRWAPGGPAANVYETAPALPDKPSIAILAFNNMSGDSEQEYFADGVTEDIITELSKYRSIFVIARNSSFAYKGRAIDIKQIGQELGVRYVLEGSVRRSAQRVRVTAQLIEAASGNHLWAERYDRMLDDVFELQDEITETIVAAIQPELEVAERERARRKSPENLSAWDHFQRGMWHSYRATPEDTALAEACFRDALAVDPHYASAHAGMGYSGFQRTLYFAQGETPAARTAMLDEAIAHVRAALAIDDRDPFGQFVLGRLYSLRGDFDDAVERLRRAIELNPNFALAYHGLGYALTLSDRETEATDAFERALRLSPADQYRWGIYSMASFNQVLLGNHETAIEYARKGIRDKPNIFWAHVHLISALSSMCRDEEARRAAEDLLKIQPDFTTAMIDRAIVIKGPKVRDRYLASLHKAGLPA
jgi:adenylate cyclase